MSRIPAACLLLAAVLIQVTVLARLAPAPVPNLVVALVVARAWVAGPGAVLGWAATGGLLLDLAATGAFGTHLLATVVSGYVAASITLRLEDRSLLPLIPAAFAAAVAHTAILVVAADLLGDIRLDPASALATAALSAAVTAPAAIVPAWVWTRSRRERLRTW